MSPIKATVDVAPRLEAHQVTIGVTLSMVTPHPPLGVVEKGATALPSEFNVTPDTSQVTVSVPGGGAVDVTVTTPLKVIPTSFEVNPVTLSPPQTTVGVDMDFVEVTNTLNVPPIGIGFCALEKQREIATGLGVGDAEGDADAEEEADCDGDADDDAEAEGEADADDDGDSEIEEDDDGDAEGDGTGELVADIEGEAVEDNDTEDDGVIDSD